MSYLPSINLCTGATTTGNNIHPDLGVYCADSWNRTNNIVVLASKGWTNSGYWNGSRIVLDGSYATNSSKGSYGNTIIFQSEVSSGDRKTNMTISGRNKSTI